MSAKIIANTIVIATTTAETLNRFHRVYNSNTTVVANVMIGANSTTIHSTFPIGPGQSITIDLGEMRPEFGGTSAKWLKLEADCVTVFATPTTNGD